MKLIVGLGNPGAQYERTRHNAGFMAVDRLVDRHARGAIARQRFSGLLVESEIRSARAPGSARALLLKPMTYMNRSGQAVAEAARFYKLDPAADILVIVDDVYLDVGSLRLRADGGAGGHNGLSDIERALGSDKYARCRVGVGPRDPQIAQADFVLGRFTEEQAPKLDTALGRAVQAAELWAVSGITHAMNAFNAPEREARVRPARPSPASTEHAAGGDAPGDSRAPDPGASRPSASGESPSPTAGFRGTTGSADVHRSPDSRQII